MITHSVFFNLKHSDGSDEEAAFLERAMELSSIALVKNFECVREISPKNKYSFGLIMQFDDRSGYDLYNESTDHRDFVEKFWIPEVKDYIEIDYIGCEEINS